MNKKRLILFIYSFCECHVTLNNNVAMRSSRFSLGVLVTGGWYVRRSTSLPSSANSNSISSGMYEFAVHRVEGKIVSNQFLKSPCISRRLTGPFPYITCPIIYLQANHPTPMRILDL